MVFSSNAKGKTYFNKGSLILFFSIFDAKLKGILIGKCFRREIGIESSGKFKYLDKSFQFLNDSDKEFFQTCVSSSSSISGDSF